MLYPERMLLKLPSGTLCALDGLAENRSDFVRGLILAAVSGECSGAVSGDPLVRDDVTRPCAVLSDADVLLGLLRDRSLSSRDAGKVLGWMDGRVERAERELINAQLVFYRSGLLVAS